MAQGSAISQAPTRAMLMSGSWKRWGASAPGKLESSSFVGQRDVGSLSGGENKTPLQINIVRSTVNKAQPQGGRSLKEN